MAAIPDRDRLAAWDVVDVAVTVAIARSVVRRVKAPRWVDRDELFQEATLAAFLAWRTYDHARGNRVQTWQYLKATGAVRDHVRKLGPGLRHGARFPRSLDARFDDGDGGTTTLLDQLRAAPDTHQDDAWLAQLWKLVDALSPQNREAFRLVHEAEMTPADAADLLGIQLATMHRRLDSARRSLRSALGSRDGVAPVRRARRLLDRRRHQRGADRRRC